MKSKTGEGFVKADSQYMTALPRTVVMVAMITYTTGALLKRFLVFNESAVAIQSMFGPAIASLIPCLQSYQLNTVLDSDSRLTVRFGLLYALGCFAM